MRTRTSAEGPAGKFDTDNRAGAYGCRGGVVFSTGDISDLPSVTGQHDVFAGKWGTGGGGGGEEEGGGTGLHSLLKLLAESWLVMGHYHWGLPPDRLSVKTGEIPWARTQ